MAAASNDSPNFLSVVCPSCDTRITATIAFAGKEISCPACLTPVHVPPLEQSTEPRAAPSKKQSEKPQPEPEAEIETIPLSRPASKTEDDELVYEVGRPVERPVVTVEVFKTVPQVKRQRVETPPKSLFFSNVFSFPWATAEAAERWCYLSAGFMLSGLSYSVCVWMLQKYDDNRGWLGVSFFLMVMVWFVVWSLSYAASNALAIVQETASGNNRVVGWGEGSWRDWAFELVTMIWIFSIAGMIALIVAWPMHFLLGSVSPLLACLLVVTFPAIWLSAMDAETLWLPFSMVVFRSFSRVSQSWAQFLGLSLCLLVVVLGSLLPLAFYHPWVAGFVAGPVLASAVFLYARLLGRLGWKIADVMSRPEPVRRRQQMTK